MTAADPPFKPGDRIRDQYEVRELLGRGGHAFVYRCFDVILDLEVAVKVIPEPSGRGRELLDRGKDEAKFLFRIKHPNVVDVITAFEQDGRMICIVMELLDGVSLRLLLPVFGRLSVIEALLIARQVTWGIMAAHKEGGVHRDIKPDNIMVLRPKNQVKVLDFGIAKFLGLTRGTGRNGKFHGTALYMSPEHLQGEAVTFRSDMYQVGTVLFEMIVGVPPVLIDLDDDVSKISWAQISRKTPSLRRCVPGVPQAVEDLIATSTAKKPHERYSSMDTFLAAIEQALRESIAATPVESRNVRYVDENVIHVAAALGKRFHSNALLARPQSGFTPVPLVNPHPQPFEVWDTDMMSNPGFGESTGPTGPESAGSGMHQTSRPTAPTHEPEPAARQTAEAISPRSLQERTTQPVNTRARAYVPPTTIPPREQRIRLDKLPDPALVEVRPEPAADESDELESTPGSLTAAKRSGRSNSSWPSIVAFSIALGVTLGVGVVLAGLGENLLSTITSPRAPALAARAAPSAEVTAAALVRPPPSEPVQSATPTPNPIEVEPRTNSPSPAARAPLPARRPRPVAKRPPQSAASASPTKSDADRVRERARAFADDMAKEQARPRLFLPEY